MAKIKVKNSLSTYDIFIDYDLNDCITSWFLNLHTSYQVLVITDENVAHLYREKLFKLLKLAHKKPFLYVIKVGESSKSLYVVEKILTTAIKLHIDRNTPILALGGGVVSDVAGFVASIYLRGVPLIVIPTTLLAQVDASVGGKVAVNHRLGKNLIGSFYNPEVVFIDISYLTTLPRREFFSAMAEIIKYGIIYDEDFFAFLEKNAKNILAQEEKNMYQIICKSCEIKAKIVSLDEKDRGIRKILNFGHTFAHALEIYACYQYTHGEAVAIGIHVASLISYYLGYIRENTVKRIQNILDAYHLPKYIKPYPFAEIFQLIKRDKKSSKNQVEWVLTQGIGTYICTKDIPAEIVQKALSEISLDKDSY